MKKVAFIVVICIAVKLAASFGAEAKAEDLFYQLAQEGSTVSQILASEIGMPAEDLYAGSSLSTLFMESPLLSAGRSLLTPSFFDDNDSEVEEDDKPNTDIPSDGAESQTPSADSQAQNDVIETKINLNDNAYQSADGIYIKNKTDYSVDIEALLNEPLDLTLDLSKPQILIVHTHGSEAYTPDGEDVYEETDHSRTEDFQYNVIRVGDELEKALKERGISVIHDRALYDYPSYTGSYDRSLEAINRYLNDYPDIKIVIDLHRDALEDENGTIYKTVADIDGKKSAQVMMVVGSNASGLEHPNWQQNLKLALHLQSAMNQKYPSLARPISISQYRYNQHATTGSLILEVGCNGNTLQEALTAIHFFADSAAEVLQSLAENK